MSPTNRFLGLSFLTASLCLTLMSGAPTARADTIPVKSAELRVEDESYVLNAQFDVAFNPTLEEALQKGVALYFVLAWPWAKLFGTGEAGLRAFSAVIGVAVVPITFPLREIA